MGSLRSEEQKTLNSSGGSSHGGSTANSNAEDGLWYLDTHIRKDHQRIERLIYEAQQKVHFQRQEAHQLQAEAYEAEQLRLSLAADRAYVTKSLQRAEQARSVRKGMKEKLIELFSLLKEKQLELSHVQEAEELSKSSRPLIQAKRKHFKEWLKLLEKNARTESIELSEVHARTAKVLLSWQESEMKSMDVSQRESLRRVYRLRAQQLKEMQKKESFQLSEAQFLKMKHIISQFNLEMEFTALMEQKEVEHFIERNTLLRAHKREKTTLKKQVKQAVDKKRQEMQNELHELKQAQLFSESEQRAANLSKYQYKMRKERLQQLERLAEEEHQKGSEMVTTEEDAEKKEDMAESSNATHEAVMASDPSSVAMSGIMSLKMGMGTSTLTDKQAAVAADEEEMADVMKEFGRAVDTLKATHKKVYDDVTKMHEEQAVSLTSKQQGEVQKLSQKHEIAIQKLRSDWEQQGKEKIGLFELAQASMKKNHQRQKAELVSGHKREHALLVQSLELEKQLHTQIVTQNQLENDVKSEFLSFVCHELRNPLSGVVAIVNMVLEDADADEEVKEHIRTIQHESELMCKIVNDVLDFSKIESNVLVLDPVEFNLHKMLSSLHKEHQLVMQKERPQLRIVLEMAEGLPEVVNADATRLRQILLNLISNAVKFTFEGYIKLTVSVESQTNKNGWLILFSVKDTGVGIAAEDLEHIFTAFSQASKSTTREFGGTGLGLGISKALVERLGGSMHVKSEKDKGTEFLFTVRMYVVEMKAKAALEKKTTSTPELSLTLPQKMEILVVEDSATLCRLWAKILTNLGCVVTTAGNGKIALEHCAKTKFPVVLMDISMPVMSGDKAVAELRAGGWEGVVIALTANAMELDRLKYLEMGMDAVVTKPFQAEALVAKIIECLEKRGTIPVA